MGRPVSPMTAQDYESMLERARKNLPTTAQSQSEKQQLARMRAEYREHIPKRHKPRKPSWWSLPALAAR